MVPVLLGAAGLAIAYVTEGRWLGLLTSERRGRGLWYVVFGSLGLLLGIMAAWKGAPDVPLVVALVALLLTAAYDLRYRLVFPIQVVGLVVVLGLAHAFLGANPTALKSSRVGAIAVASIMSLLYFVAGLLYGFGALGSGDIFVGLLIGAALGWPLALLGLFLGAFLGGVGATLALLRGVGRRAYMPYGAMLCFGAAIALSLRWLWPQVPPVADWLTRLETLLQLI